MANCRTQLSLSRFVISQLDVMKFHLLPEVLATDAQQGGGFGLVAVGLVQSS